MAVLAGAQLGEGDLQPPVGVPGVEGFAAFQRAGIRRVGSRHTVGEGARCLLEVSQRGVWSGERRVEQVPDGHAGGGVEFLLGDAERADEMHGPGVGAESPGEGVQQGRLAASVLADDSQAGAGGDGEIDLVQDDPSAARNGQPGGGELRCGPGRRRGIRVDLGRWVVLG